MSKISDFLDVSARANVQAALDRAKQYADYNVFISLSEKRALERADLVDKGEITGRLAGVPFVAKDNFLTVGDTTTAASKILQDFKSPLQATAIEKLETEGAICIGKANLDAFAHGGSTENSFFGPTKNAIDQNRVAGGSSGGSAVAVALGIVPFALGSDTGGSIRQPASFNGIVGLKPTYGAVSRFGVVAMASSTDVIGVLSSNISDAELVMEIISGQDKRDMTTLPDFYKSKESTGTLRIGVISESLTDDVDVDVRNVTNNFVDNLEKNGHDVQNISLPMLKHSLAIYYIVTPAEVSSNLARYDGVRYGLRAESDTLEQLYGKSRDQGFMAENKRRIMIGSYVLSSGFYDAYYLKAQRARTLLINQFNDLFNDYDILVSPTSPTPAFSLGDRTGDPIKMYMADIMTVPASLAGLPAVSIPAGKDSDGLPVGVQLIGPRRSDAKILALARSLEDK